ncbi:MAG: C25 family cysteine peptidase [Rhodanobacteraceae bacterium]
MTRQYLFRLTALALCALPASVFACGGRLHIELANAGVYTLDYDAVVARQPDLADCTAAELRLAQNGKEVPIRIVGASDGRFAPGARIEWIGHRLHGPESWYDAYSTNNVYMLGAGAGPHARISDLQAPATTPKSTATLRRDLHLEQENLMIRLDQFQQKPGEEPDVWQWAKLTQVDPKPFSTTFDLPDLAARGPAVKLTLDFRGLSDLGASAKHAKPLDHTIEIRLNGKPLPKLAWDGRDEIRRDFMLPATSLKTHGNTLSLDVPKRALPWKSASSIVDVIMFNWLDVAYPVDGSFVADGPPLRVGTGATGAIELASTSVSKPVLYGDDGHRRRGHALGHGRYAFAPAPAGVELYPVGDTPRHKPDALRAVTDVDWHHPARGYDYLIVSHPSLIDATRPLAEFHRRRGHTVAILDVNQVYDEFNHGIDHPQAIRNLVDYAYHHWPAPRPRFLLLVGDASFDIRHTTYNDLAYEKFAGNTAGEVAVPHGFLAVPGTPYADVPGKLADRNLIPTWQFPSAEGQSASDNWYGAVVTGDYHPVVAVGRFPVVKPAEVSAIVRKTIDYLSKPQLGSWRRDVMFITDENDYFKKASDAIAANLGAEGFAADKVYASAAEKDNLAHQSAIREGLDDGRLLVHFIGHGGRYIWRTGPPDLRKNHDLFTLKDVSSLRNGAHLPMVLSMTCYSAPFDNPTEDSIGERFLREPDRGAIAVFAASWRNAPSPNFSKTLVEELLKPGATIGEAIVRAKSSIQNRTLVEMYNLLGDPAVVLERPRDEARLALDDDHWNPGVMVNLPESRFAGSLTVNWLDDKGITLLSRHYRVGTPRFRLDVPSLPDGRPAEVRIYAASPTSGHDAIGALALASPVKPAWTTELAAWWRDLTRPTYKPAAWTADTVSRSGFESGETRPSQSAATSVSTAGRAAAARVAVDPH